MDPWIDPEAWSQRRAGDACPLCTEPSATEIAWSTENGRLLVRPIAPLRGYACFVAREHIAEWHEMPRDAAGAFLRDLNHAAAVVQRVTGAAKINLLSLGNLVPHLHVHICPRRTADRFIGRALDPGDVTEVYAGGEFEAYVASLRSALDSAPRK